MTKVRAERTFPLVEPVERHAVAIADDEPPPWGMTKIGADDVWADGITRQRRRGRQHRHRRRLHARGARRAVPREPRGDLRPRLLLVGPHGDLRRRPLRQRPARHAHDGHDGRWRRPRTVHAGHRRRAGRELDRREGVRGLLLQRDLAPLVGRVHARPDRPERRQPRPHEAAGHRQQLMGRRPRGRLLRWRSSRPGARRASSLCSRRATRDRNATRAAPPETTSSRSAWARPT